MSECSKACSSCEENCNDREAPQSFLIQPLANSKIKKIIGVVSGKGGVGKSSISALCAVLMNRKGYNVGIIDADITGPSIPNMFNLHQKAHGNATGILPCVTKSGIKVMSMNLLLDNPNDSVIYRGPVIGGIVKQFYSDVVWEDIDFLFVDMPPGTGDVPLSVYQSYPIDGILIVSTPQQLVSMIVSKACDMANKMNISILGIIENMAYVKCNECGNKLELFKNSHIDDVANEYGLSILARLPLMNEIMEAADNGTMEDLEINNLSDVVEEIELLLKEQKSDMIIAMPFLNEEISGHFGKSKEFALYTISENKVVNKQLVTSANGGHSALPVFLKEHHVNTLICLNLGDAARKALKEVGIGVIGGVSGLCDKAIHEYILNNLVDSEQSCSCSDDKCDCEHH